MQSFKDATGRKWDIEITAAEIEDLLEIGVDLGKKEDVDSIFADTKKFLQVLWVLLGDQIKATNITDRQLKKSFGPDQWDAAATATMDAILLFSPSRAAAAKILAAVRTRRAAMMESAETKAEAVAAKITSGKLDVELGFANTSGDSAGLFAGTPGEIA